MQRRHLLFFFGCLCLLVQCKPVGSRFARLWFYAYRSETGTEKDAGLTPASFLYLGKNGNYTRDFGVFDYGTWAVKDGAIVLTGYKNKITRLPIKKMKGNDMELVLSDQSVADFESFPGTFAAAGRNPFSRENNGWRIPALGKETDGDIDERLRSHFRFWETYFTWAMDNNLSSIDVRSTPTLLKIYGNGFALKPFEELPEEWRAIFFDAEDCRKANARVKHIFETSDIAWAQTENKYKMFVSAFQQLQREMK